MNTRVQVEHCVTETVTGVDIVREQILHRRGRAALDQPGRRRARTATRSSAASTPRTRRRTSPPRPARSPTTASRPGPACAWTPASLAGTEITPLYDPMVAKLIVWDADREHATRRMLRALERVRDRGRAHADPVPQGDHGLRAVGQRRDLPRPDRGQEVAEGARRSRSPTGRRTRTRREGRAQVRRRGLRQALRGQGRRRGPVRARAANGAAPAAGAQAARAERAQRRRRRRRRRAHLAAAGQRASRSLVEKGAEVEEGALICVIEAMKMENEITAHKAGTIEELADVRGRRGQDRRHARRHQVAGAPPAFTFRTVP